MSWKVGKINLKWLWGTKESAGEGDGQEKGRIKAHNWHEWHFYFPQWWCCCCCKYSLIYSPKKWHPGLKTHTASQNIDSSTTLTILDLLHYVIVRTTDTLFFMTMIHYCRSCQKMTRHQKKLSKEHRSSWEIKI